MISIENPCNPSPCGPNSVCREHLNKAVCSCLEKFIGSPPNCRPECVHNNECSVNKACLNFECVDPCTTSSCGSKAICKTRYHVATCTCPEPLIGNPFVACVVPESTFYFYLDMYIL